MLNGRLDTPTLHFTSVKSQHPALAASYNKLIRRNPDNPWYLLRTAGYYIFSGEKALQKAKDCYLKAVTIAQIHLEDRDHRKRSV